MYLALFLVSKIEYCLMKIKYSILAEENTFRGWKDLSTVLDRKKLDMQSGITVKQEVLAMSKQTFPSGVILPPRISNCENCPKYVDKKWIIQNQKQPN